MSMEKCFGDCTGLCLDVADSACNAQLGKEFEEMKKKTRDYLENQKKESMFRKTVEDYLRKGGLNKDIRKKMEEYLRSVSTVNNELRKEIEHYIMAESTGSCNK